MGPLQIAVSLQTKFQDNILNIEEFRDQVSVFVNKSAITDICTYLRDEPTLTFDFLRDITAVDWLDKKTPRFEVIYHLFSINNRNMIRLKAPVEEDSCQIESVVHIWRGADWHERECYDLFGISFKGHPDHRRILLPEDWEGHPLRKDYPVAGPEKEWPVFEQLVKDSERLKVNEWNR